MRLNIFIYLSIALLNFDLAWSSEKLIFAIDIIRHGDRNPTSIVKNLNHEWPEGLGELTAIGWQQAKTLGERMRERYIEKEKLLPEIYDKAVLYIHSTNVHRTIMSAQALLSGLYPEESNIPIDVLPENEKDPFAFGMKTKEEQHIFNKYVMNTDEWQKMEEQYKSQYAFWENICGFTINNMRDVSTLTDALNIALLKAVPIPPELTAKDLETMRFIRNWVHFQTAENVDLGKIVAIRALSLIIHILQIEAKQSENRAKDRLHWILYSAHDTALMGLMAKMGSPLKKIPHYVSNLNFSLYRSKEGEGDMKKIKHFVRITYNNKLVVLPICGKEKCSLDKLLELVH